MQMNRRGFVLLGAAAGVFAPFVAKAKTLMRLRGPTLYTGPTIKLALIPSTDDGRATEVYNTQRIVELPFVGSAAFGGRLTVEGVTGLVAGFGGSWPVPVGSARTPLPWEQHEEGDVSRYSPEQIRMIAETLVYEKKKSKEIVFFDDDEDGNIVVYRTVKEIIG